MSEDSGNSRRKFLKATVLGAAALSLRLRGAKTAFAEELKRAEKRAQGGDGDGEAPFANLRREYSLGEGVTYLNHASIGTIPKVVQAAHRRYLEICETNPWLHMWGEAWVEPLAEVRRRAASFLGCETSEVTFSHNTTETFNLLARGLPLGEGDEVLFSTLNHSGASVCWEHAAEVRGFSVRRFDFPIHEVPGLASRDVVRLYAEAVRPETRVLVLPHVDNTVGLLHPVQEIAAAARRRGVEVIAVDGAQPVGMLPVDVSSLGVDVYAGSAHKWLQAPKGLGLAYIRRELQDRLRPMWVTWGQKLWQDSARKYEDYGTRNLAEVLTLGNALQFQEALGANALEEHHRRLWTHAKDRIDGEPSLTWHSPRQWSESAALYSAGIQGVKASELFQNLFRTHGFVFRPFEVHGLNAVRISPNAFNTTKELDRLISHLAAVSRAPG